MIRFVLLFTVLNCFFSLSLPAQSRRAGREAGFEVRPGDVLVYHVKFYSKEYDFVVTLRSFGESINFSWYMTHDDNQRGNVNIQPAAVQEAIAYNNYFNGEDLNLSSQSTVWLSHKNFRELSAGSSRMKIDRNETEKFTRKEDKSFNIRYKGKEIAVPGFRVENGKSAFNQRQLWILNQSTNPLILKMDLGWTIELKEVR